MKVSGCITNQRNSDVNVGRMHARILMVEGVKRYLIVVFFLHEDCGMLGDRHCWLVHWSRQAFRSCIMLRAFAAV